MIVYIRPENPFPELESFVDDTTRQFNLNMKIISGDIKTVIDSILKSNPELKACLMGSRRTDPYCENLDFFQVRKNNFEVQSIFNIH